MAEGWALKIEGCFYAVFGLTDMRRRSEAKHCSSLCSQSEGGRILWQTRRKGVDIKRTYGIFATCSWPSLCEQSELQCWRRNKIRDMSPLQGRGS